MLIKSFFRTIMIIILISSFITGCKNITDGPGLSSADSYQISGSPELSAYIFHGSIDPVKRYLFYLHGKIIEDQGLPAIDPEYGEYEYEAILAKLSRYGFVVFSEPRYINTDSVEYAHKIAGQVILLLNAGVPPKNITIVGASKGAGIAIYVSYFLANTEINYVLMGICNPENVEYYLQEKLTLYGNVLSIYDSGDDSAGSCQELFNYSKGKGISRSDEIILQIGTGHGILYKPLDEWITPLVQWAGK